MRLEQLPDAELEATEAADYYERQRPGLGIRFLEELQRSFQIILDAPERWGRFTSRTRRCRLNKFPYGVVYEVRPELVLVVAVMHLHRRPGYWRRRLR